MRYSENRTYIKCSVLNIASTFGFIDLNGYNICLYAFRNMVILVNVPTVGFNISEEHGTLSYQ